MTWPETNSKDIAGPLKSVALTSCSALPLLCRDPGFHMDGWHAISWKDVYAWGHKHKNNSHWAERLVDYFNVAEAKMTSEEYLQEGTITEFSGISFEPYNYLEGKRVLRLANPETSRELKVHPRNAS